MTGAHDMEFVTDDHPMSTGRQPHDAAPHDVLRGTPFENHRVDDDVEEERPERQPGGQPVDGETEQQGRHDRQRDAESEALTGADHAGDERTLRGALHEGVDVAVDVHVERVGAARGQITAEAGEEHQLQIRHTLLGQEHHRNGGDQQQLDDPRLGQRHERLDTGPERPLAPAAARPEHTRWTGFDGRHAHP